MTIALCKKSYTVRLSREKEVGDAVGGHINLPCSVQDWPTWRIPQSGNDNQTRVAV